MVVDSIFTSRIQIGEYTPIRIVISRVFMWSSSSGKKSEFWFVKKNFGYGAKQLVAH